ncbi:hypothetical protein LLG96_06350 [bacterium]|nr:hypothetical protein [bacterium]
MRIMILFMMLAVLAAPVFAEEEETLFSGYSGNFVPGGFISPDFKVTPINGKTELLVGGRGGWIINHSFSIGAAGYGLVTIPKAPKVARIAEDDVTGELRDMRIGMGYGGLQLEYVFMPQKLVHASISTLVGGGGIGYFDIDDDDDDHDSGLEESDGFFVFEPAVEGTVNVTKYFRISAGVSYRVIGGLDVKGLETSDLQGLAGSLTFRFGVF